MFCTLLVLLYPPPFPSALPHIYSRCTCLRTSSSWECRLVCPCHSPRTSDCASPGLSSGWRTDCTHTGSTRWPSVAVSVCLCRRWCWCSWWRQHPGCLPPGSPPWPWRWYSCPGTPRCSWGCRSGRTRWPAGRLQYQTVQDTNTWVNYQYNIFRFNEEMRGNNGWMKKITQILVTVWQSWFWLLFVKWLQSWTLHFTAWCIKLNILRKSIYSKCKCCRSVRPTSFFIYLIERKKYVPLH